MLGWWNGIHDGLKIRWRKPYEFESRPEYIECSERYKMEFVVYIMSFVAFVVMPIYGIIKLQKIEAHLKGK
jgi:hypothetical protein